MYTCIRHAVEQLYFAYVSVVSCAFNIARVNSECRTSSDSCFVAKKNYIARVKVYTSGLHLQRRLRSIVFARLARNSRKAQPVNVLDGVRCAAPRRLRFAGRDTSG